MDHKMISEGRFVDRYLSDRLSESETLAFEEHYLSCPQCLDELEATEGLKGGFQELSRVEGQLVQAAVPSVGHTTEVQSVRSETLTPSFQGDVPSGKRSRLDALGLSRLLLAAGLALSLGWSGWLYSQLIQVRASSRDIALRLDQARLPDGQPVVMPMDSVRSSGQSSGAPAYEVELEGVSQLILSLEIDDQLGDRFGAELLASSSRLVWQAEAHRSLLGGVIISIPAAILAPGDFSIRLSSQTREEQHVFRFRVRSVSEGSLP